MLLTTPLIYWSLLDKRTPSAPQVLGMSRTSTRTMMMVRKCLARFCNGLRRKLAKEEEKALEEKEGSRRDQNERGGSKRSSPLVIGGSKFGSATLEFVFAPEERDAYRTKPTKPPRSVRSEM